MSTLKTNNIQHVDRSDPSIIISTDGSVSIAGTLTYEDVTSVDAVGIVTAREIINAQKQVLVGTGVSVKAGGLNVTAGITTVQALQATTGTFSAAVSGTTGTFTGDVDIADKIIHTGDTNTAIRFPAADTVTMEVGGSETFRITGVGATISTNNSNDSELTIVGTGGATLHLKDSGSGEHFRLSANGQASLYAVSSDPMVFYTGGTASGNERLRITSGGDIGVGNDTPNCRLAVKDTATHTAYAKSVPSVGDCMLQLYNNPSSEAINNHSTLQFGVYGGSHNRVNSISAVAESASNRKMALTFCTDSGANRSERMRISGDGSLGIGTDSPQQKVDAHNASGTTLIRASVNGNSRVGVEIAKTGATTQTWRIQDGQSANGILEFYDQTDSRSVMVLNGTGKVGINETSPQQQLHVHDDTNYKGILINGNAAPRLCFAPSGGTTPTWSLGIDGTNDQNFVINNSGDNTNRDLVIGPSQTTINMDTAIAGVLYNDDIRSVSATNDDSTSHVTISARNAAGGHGNYFIVGTSGNIYFGANASSYNVNPAGNNINAATTIRVHDGISANALNNAHRFGRNGDGSIMLFFSAGSTEGSIAISGSTTNYNTSSDYRLKENIIDISDGITRLKQLKPRRFNFIKDPSTTKDGFIAHEVSSIVPEAVQGTKDETFSKDDEDNNIKAGDPKYQQMDAGKLVPLLTAALQEEVAKTEGLETRIETLEAQIAALIGG